MSPPCPKLPPCLHQCLLVSKPPKLRTVWPPERCGVILLKCTLFTSLKSCKESHCTFTRAYRSHKLCYSCPPFRPDLLLLSLWSSPLLQSYQPPCCSWSLPGTLQPQGLCLLPSTWKASPWMHACGNTASICFRTVQMPTSQPASGPAPCLTTWPFSMVHTGIQRGTCI